MALKKLRHLPGHEKGVETGKNMARAWRGDRRQGRAWQRGSINNLKNKNRQAARLLKKNSPLSLSYSVTDCLQRNFLNKKSSACACDALYERKGTGRRDKEGKLA